MPGQEFSHIHHTLPYIFKFTDFEYWPHSHRDKKAWLGNRHRKPTARRQFAALNSNTQKETRSGQKSYAIAKLLSVACESKEKNVFFFFWACQRRLQAKPKIPIEISRHVSLRAECNEEIKIEKAKSNDFLKIEN